LYLNALVAPKTKTKFKRYLQQDQSLRKINIYAFWKAKQYNYLIVAHIAKDYLSILATLVLSKCVFSQRGDIVTKKRNKLTSDSIRMIVCLKA
jgi:hAT family C-terminal dimerisation region